MVRAHTQSPLDSIVVSEIADLVYRVKTSFYANLQDPEGAGFPFC